ncbi:MAG: tyrosine-protein phosphatase [Porticoccaceae bacterium]
MINTDRSFLLEGAHNFRDFGGYDTVDGSRLRRGVLFRSDALDKLTDRDHHMLEPLGIRTICDLRRSKESEKAPTLWRNPSARVLQMSMFAEGGPTFAEKIAALGEELNAKVLRRFTLSTYITLLTSEHAHSRYREIFTLLAKDTDVPILIHCSGGKDRTGMVCALTQWVLGVHRDDIISDYLSSQSLYGDKVGTASVPPQMMEMKGFAELGPEVLKILFGVQQDYMEGVFSWLDDNGITPDNLLTELLGMDPALRDQLSRNLLES